MDDQPHTDSTNSSQEIPTRNDIGVQPVYVETSKKGNKKRVLIMLSALVALVVVAGLAYSLVMSSGENNTADSSPTNASNSVIEQPKTPSVNDYFYIANSIEKIINVYDTKGNKISSKSIPTDLIIPTSGIDANDNIQLVNGADRIFYLAGEDPNDPFSGEPLTYELFELVDEEPTQLFSAPEGQRVEDWIVINGGKEIVFQTSKIEADKTVLRDIKILDVATKSVKQLVDYTERSATWYTALVYDEKAEAVYYFRTTDGSVEKTAISINDGRVVSKKYDLSCSGQGVFCSVEYPDFASTNDDYFVWGYNSFDGRFGVEIVEAASGNVVADYELSDTYESIGSVFWNNATNTIGFDVHAFGNDGQQKVGREPRVMELGIGSDEPTTVFSDVSPGGDDYEAWQTTNVTLYGYSASGKYALIRNENVYKILNLETKNTESTVQEVNSDSSIYISWLK